MGSSIADARKRCGMSQEALSKKSGVSRATIARLESGEDFDVLASTVLKLAEALDTTVDALFSAKTV